MSCDLSLGRLEPCKDNVGGITAVYFVNFDDLAYSDMTITNEEITAVTGTISAYKYEVKGANTYDEANENSRENGTSFWTQTGTIQLKSQSAASQKELKLMSYGRPKIIVQYYNGDYRMAGAKNGCECAVSTASGSAMGDFNGYNIAFSGTEEGPAIYADISDFTVVVGT